MLERSVVRGFFWNSTEKFALFFIQFVVGIVLARLLLPADFGLIGIVAFFIAISQSFVDGGLSSGLIHKQKLSRNDCSTVFIVNIILGVVIYVALFISAPFLAAAYGSLDLTSLIRILALVVILNSTYVVQKALLVIELEFKILSHVNVLSLLISGFFGIYLAYAGCGVWALVAQSLSRSVIGFVFFWLYGKWKPSIIFSVKSFRELFGFGSKILVTGVVAQIFNGLYVLVIGKWYSKETLGFYDRARSYSEIPSGIVSGVMSDVSYPVLASLKDDQNRMTQVYSQLFSISVFLMMPVMSILALLADPLVRVFLTEAWLPLVPLFQWLCFSRFFFPIIGLNSSLVNALGRSDVYLKMNVVQLLFAIIALLFTISLNLKAIVIGQVLVTVVGFLINEYVPYKFLKYDFFRQMKDLLITIMSTAAMLVVVWFLIGCFDLPTLKLIIGGASGALIYLLLNLLLKSRHLDESISFIRSGM